MPSIVSPFMNAAEFARHLGVDSRTFRAAVKRGDVPPATSTSPTSGRALWNRADVVKHYRALAAELKATSDLVGILNDIRSDKRESIEGRRIANDALRALIDGADPVEIANELSTTQKVK